ncbi:MAG: cyclic nucleotide-binding domain-containing protein [Nitrospinaceae bacterium]
MKKIIRENPFFVDFDEEEVNELLGIDGIVLDYDGGQFIVRQGDVGSALFILLDGKVIISKNPAHNLALATLKPWAIFGESPMVLKSERLTNVIADGPVKVFKMDADRFES